MERWISRNALHVLSKTHNDVKLPYKNQWITHDSSNKEKVSPRLCTVPWLTYLIRLHPLRPMSPHTNVPLDQHLKPVPIDQRPFRPTEQVCQQKLN